MLQHGMFPAKDGHLYKSSAATALDFKTIDNALDSDEKDDFRVLVNQVQFALLFSQQHASSHTLWM